MEQDFTMVDNGNKSLALSYLKAYYEDFHNKYAATDPNKVKSIQYFLDWLKSSATPDDIVVTEVNSSIRTCQLNVEVEYFWKFGTDRYSDYHYMSGNVTGLVCENQEFVSYFNDVYLSPEATNKIVPGCIKDIAKEEGRKAMKNADRDAIFSEVKILGYEISDPQPNPFLSCRVNYPHPVADKAGNTIRSFAFIIWKDELYMINSLVGPDDVSGKSATSGGCYVATAVYGSYNCPEVWTLRRYRDNTLGSTWYGRLFIRLYYAISPTLVRLFGKTSWFKKMWKRRLDKMVKKLNDTGVENTPYDDIDWRK